MYLGGFFPFLKEQRFPEVSCQKDLSIQGTPYKMSCTVTMFKSPFDAMPLKVMHTACCHVENDPSGVKERQMKGRRGDMTNEAKDRPLNVYSLQCRSRRKEFQGHQDEKNRTISLKSHFLPLQTNTTSSLCFFPPFCLFHSPLSVSSPWSGCRQRVSALTQRSL